MDTIAHRHESVNPEVGEASMSLAEQRLLDFAGELILDLAHTHSRVTQQQIADWIARVVVGTNR